MQGIFLITTYIAFLVFTAEAKASEVLDAVADIGNLYLNGEPSADDIDKYEEKARPLFQELHTKLLEDRQAADVLSTLSDALTWTIKKKHSIALVPFIRQYSPQIDKLRAAEVLFAYGHSEKTHLRDGKDKYLEAAAILYDEVEQVTQLNSAGCLKEMGQVLSQGKALSEIQFKHLEIETRMRCLRAIEWFVVSAKKKTPSTVLYDDYLTLNGEDAVELYNKAQHETLEGIPPEAIEILLFDLACSINPMMTFHMHHYGWCLNYVMKRGTDVKGIYDKWLEKTKEIKNSTLDIQTWLLTAPKELANA